MLNRKTLLKFFFPLIALINTTISFGQQNAYSQKGSQLVLNGKDRKLLIDFCTPNVFRTRVSWNRSVEPDEPWMVVKYDWAPVKINVSKEKSDIIVSTSQLKVKVNSLTLQMEVRTKDGKLLSSENTVGGSFRKGDTIGCRKQMLDNEYFFGFGERMDFLNRRGKKLKLDVGRGKGQPHITGAYNVLEANYSPVPFFMSTNGYGIFFHNAYPTEWDMGNSQQNSYSFSAAGGELDYYFIYGPTFPVIMDHYTSITGKSPLMPLFAYGLHVGTYSGGTWGYEQFTSDMYVYELAKKLREMGIPADIIWLDSTWRIFGTTGGKGATSFEWRETFKDPKGMFDSLYALKYKMVGLHLRPRFDNGKSIRLLDTAQQLKFTYPEGDYAGEFVNYFDSSSVNWWWEHGVKRVANIGAKFLKTDEGSAFGALANESNKKGPQGKDIARLHNLFPLAYAKAPYEKFQAFNGVRGMNHTREGYAGIQRYPFIFAGDWPSEWQYFEPVIKAGLNIGLSGVGNWTHCMGGFEHPADPELYIRWVQFGMFSPIAMVFGMDHPGYKEPWNYGDDALKNFKKYDSLRYQLLPYIYSNSWNMHRTGAPLMRALVFDYQDDVNVYEIGDQYLFGENMMICPVTTKGAQTRSVYLPAGEWYDYWSGKKYKGKQYIQVVTPLDVLPIFIKAGSIIPMQPAMRFVGEKQVKQITLDIYTGKGSFNLYEDDGESLSYQDGNYAETKINVESEQKEAKVFIQKPGGKFETASRNYLIKYHSSIAPTSVIENAKEVSRVMSINEPGWFYDEKAKILFVTTSVNSRDLQISIRF